MVKLTFKAESFKKMEDPFDKERGHTKYICYAQVNTIPRVLEDWMNTNPREQKMTTNVAKEIIKSLEENIYILWLRIRDMQNQAAKNLSSTVRKSKEIMCRKS